MAITVYGNPAPVPFAPALVSPANASFGDLSGEPEFSWVYAPGVSGNTQSGWAFRRKVSGAASYQWWNVSTSSWQSTQVWNSGSDQSYTFPSGTWANGSTYNWSVATQDVNGNGPAATDFTVTAQAGPSVSSIQPSGTVTLAQPTFSWVPSPGAGASQTLWRVVLYTADQYSIDGFTPGVSPSTWDSGANSGAFVTSVACPVLLADGTEYEVYVQITETGGQTSAWAYSAFTTSWLAPAEPTWTIADTTDPDTGAPVVAHTITGQDGGDTASYVGLTQATVIYSDDGGTTWFAVRNGEQVPLPSDTQQAVIYDYEAPPGFTRQYEVIITVPVS